ncbi:hypothetical protein [Micromonospora arborensis]|uniref:hypothetical protein n=1 Tax=Micromonospora arborensis TaxID=2116518 RepID=UPI003712786F
MTSSPDQEVVQVCVQLLMAHVRDATVGDWDIDGVLELAGDIRAAVRQQVVEGLVGRGVVVIAAPEGDGRDGRGPAGVIDPTRAERSIVDARRLLRRDRVSSRPWDRLLTASEEVGLALLMRGISTGRTRRSRTAFAQVSTSRTNGRGPSMRWCCTTGGSWCPLPAVTWDTGWRVRIWTSMASSA